MLINPTLHQAVLFSRAFIPYGHVLEFGVAGGTTLRQLIADCPSNQVFGFDSCEGLPEDWPGTECKKGAFSNGGREPHVPGVTKFYKGWFVDTVPNYIAETSWDTPISLIHLDADLYSSTITVLEQLNARIKPGTVLVFDEWGVEGDEACREQERRALSDWVDRYQRYAVRLDRITDTTPCGPQRAVFLVVV